MRGLECATPEDLQKVAMVGTVVRDGAKRIFLLEEDRPRGWVEAGDEWPKDMLDMSFPLTVIWDPRTEGRK